MVSLALLDSLAIRSSTIRYIKSYIANWSSLGTRRSDRNMRIECPPRADVGRAGLRIAGTRRRRARVWIDEPPGGWESHGQTDAAS